MDEFPGSEKTSLNRLPTKIAKIIKDNAFFDQDESGYEDLIALINWDSWTKQEIKLIYAILKSEKFKTHTQTILKYLYSFQSLCDCIGTNKENIQNIEQFKHKMLESLNSIISPESL